MLVIFSIIFLLSTWLLFIRREQSGTTPRGIIVLVMAVWALSGTGVVACLASHIQ